MTILDFLRHSLAKTALTFVVLSTVVAVHARATIAYEIGLSHPERHIFHVRMWIPDVSGEVTVQLPAWNALYQIRDFSSHVREVSARAGQSEAPIEKLDKETWRVFGSGMVTITYDAYWDEAGPFASQLNAEHAFINPAMILMYVPERRSEAVSVGVSDLPGVWRAASSAVLTPITAAHFSSLNGQTTRGVGFGAINYDALADTPIELGNFEEFDISGMTPAVSVAIHGDKWKRKEVEDELRRICGYETRLMEGAPYQHYTFIIHVGRGAGGSGGGMEHANSTAISIRSAEDLANVAAHEFFHLWNVKRIRPASLEPVDYTKEQYTRALWFAEGVTSTYAAYTLVRTGLWSKDQFYFDLGQQITDIESRPANQWQSAEESSLDAWLEKYPIYDRPQNSVSYYSKGQVLGVLLDILIRDRTDNQKSIDDVLRSMNTEFAKQGKTYRDSLDVRLAAEHVAGGSFEDFFEKYVAHAEALPYQQTLALAGLSQRLAERKRTTLGFFAERAATGNLTVQEVDSESPAAEAGLHEEDIITSWNGGALPRNPQRWAESQKPGATLRLVVRRDEKEMTLEFGLSEATERFYQVTEDTHASDKARRIRDGLLRGITQPVTAAVH